MKKITLLLLAITALQFSSKAQSLLMSAANSKKISGLNSIPAKQMNASIINTVFANKTLAPGYNDYKRKRKNCMTTGFILLGAGLISSGIGIAVSSNSSTLDQEETAGVCFLVGATAGIASIPFMVMAHVYKHKATLSLDNKKTGSGIPFNSGSVTGLTFSMNIGK